MRFKNIVAIGLAAAAALAAIGILKKHDDAVSVQWKDADADDDSTGVVHPDYTQSSDNSNDESDKAKLQDSDANEETPCDKADENAAESVEKSNTCETTKANCDKIDANTIACAEDFQDWDERGCKG
ncbi:MAG: hypothetical protein RR612_03335 [Oscillospiraceae bacterium]